MRFTKKSFCFFLVAILMFSTGFVANPMKAEAKSSTGTVYVTGIQRNSAVQQALKLMNKERAKRGLKALKLDKGLTRSAITRSAEQTIYISTSSPHKRPNGKDRSSINKKINYEVCTFGDGVSAEKAVSNWMKSSSDKKGILKKKAKSVGISCFEVDGTMYWTADISYSKAKSTMKSKTDKKYTKKVTALNKYLEESCFRLDGWDGFVPGDEESFAVYYLGNTKYNKNLDCVLINAKSFKWSSSKPSVATVNSKGVVKIKKAGETTISAKLKNGTKIVMRNFIEVSNQK